MNIVKKQNKLNAVAAIFTIVLTIAFLGFFANNYLTKTPNEKNSVEFSKGKTIPKIEDVDFRLSKKTLLIFLSTQCKFCNKSLPFYKKLINKYVQPDKNVQLVALFREEKQLIDEYLANKELQIKSKSEVKFDDFNVAGTPTIILADDKGEIQSVWVGFQNNSQENEIMSAITQ